jgi:DNA glycosylase AlkZ-like
LLPVLDPTVMGWKERDFYLGPHREQLFDRAGNAGTTAWVDGRIVGCWMQDDDGVVAVRPLERVAAGARQALDDEAQRLTTWLNGERVNSLIRPPAMQVAPPAR